MLSALFFQFDVYQFIAFVTVIVIALSFHEYAHARMAFLLGDMTAVHAGRMTLNPLKHIDPLGAIAFLVIGFGWGRPVPVDLSHTSHPRKNDMLVAFAGPLMNIALAFFAFVIISFGLYPEQLEYFFKFFLGINITLAVFNMLPFSPLDGSHIVYNLLGANSSPVARKYLYYSAPVFISLIGLDYIFHTNILWSIISPVRDIILLIFHLIL
ncbi:MAG: site-2 protease family protein [Patescibacteria group bacterium]|nr:site-2 protease family protein [Patescibacteria group bacterium]